MNQDYVAYLETQTAQLSERVKELETFIIIKEIYQMTEDGIGVGKAYMEKKGYKLISELMKNRNTPHVLKELKESYK